MTSSIIEMTSDLVRIPSQGGIDSPEPILAYIERWLGEHGLRPRRLTDSTGASVGIVCDVEMGGGGGPRYVLDCCVDTAPIGNVRKWTRGPTEAEVVDGWLFGRGSSDSKVGIAIFCHLASRLVSNENGGLAGTLTLLFDADEHTGGFRGAKTFFEDADVRSRGVAGVMIGYPGMDEVVTACRGFQRATITVNGTAGHSGAGDHDTWRDSAVEKAAELAVRLRRRGVPDRRTDGFDLPPTLTVTAIDGGESWSIVPDTCALKVDMRLTPTFAASAARALLREEVAALDESWPTVAPTSIEFLESWPAYSLPADSAVASALVGAAAARAMPVRRAVVGPSNIGNYLASRGIEATAGFGVRFRGLHGLDECIDLASIAPVSDVYETAIHTLLAR